MKANHAIGMAAVFAAILAGDCRAQLNGCDDFNDNSKDPARWGSDFSLKPEGRLIETNGRLKLVTSAVPASSALVARPWILNFGSSTQNWEAHLDANLPHLGFPESSFGLLVALGINRNFNNRFSVDLFESATEIQPRKVFMRVGVNSPDDMRVAEVPTASILVGLRIAFDAQTKTLSAYYDEDGPNSGYAWTLLGSTNIAAAWHLTPGSVFSVWVGGRVEETSRVVTSADNLFGDNFCASSGPNLSAPVITAQPRSRTNLVGEAASFSVSAAGVAPLSYQWRFKNADLPDLTSRILNLSNVQLDNAGSYRVVVSNMAGSVTSAVANLKVWLAPSITTPPESRTNIAGTTASFSVIANGSPAPGYRWLRNGVTLPGATNSSLILAGVQPAQAGTYRVVVSNAVSSVISAAATLTVLAPPSVLQPPASRTNVIGTTARFSVIATGAPPLSFQWRFKGTNLPDETNASLVLSNVQLANAGSYRVVVTNIAGAATSAVASLTVWVPSTITQQPRNRTNVLGTTASFSIVATGVPPPSFQWRFNGVNLPGATSSNLALANVQPSLAGSYRVVAFNGAGAVTSAPAVLTVTVPASVSRDFTWARRVARTVNPDDEFAMGFAVDAARNSYVAGWFDGANNFGGTTLTSYGGQDIFVAKYNASGALVWARQAGSANSQWEYGRGVGVDASGNVYLAGGFVGTASFGNTNLTASNFEGDFFLARLNSAGVFQWVRQAGDVTGQSYATSLAVDAAGNSWAVGYFEGSTMEFDGATIDNAGDYDIFLVKHDSAGALQWAKSLGGPSQDYSERVIVDGSGNCYVTGSFEGTASIGTTNLTSAGGRDAFIAKFDPTGNLLWARRGGGSGKDGAIALAVNARGDVVVGGNFSGTATFGGISLTSAGNWDIFVVEYNSAGTAQWVRRAGGPGLDAAVGAALDEDGNCILAGTFASTAQFGALQATSAGGWDNFVAGYSATGTPLWIRRSGGTSNELIWDLRTTPAGDVRVAGLFQGTSVIGTNTLASGGVWNFFLAAMTQPSGLVPAPAPSQPILGISRAGNGPTLRVVGEIGATLILEYTPELFGRDSWQPMGTIVLTNNSQPLIDPSGGSAPRRFYRLRQGP